MGAVGRVVEIQRFCINDGPGIRTTVFLKGCPLRCLWCSNPETQLYEKEIIARYWKCYAECEECIINCPTGALSKSVDRMVMMDGGKCGHCLRCSNLCKYGALEIIGLDMNVPDVISEAVKDEIFYRTSGGGVTISGGEPLLQGNFLLELAEALKGRGIHLALDTSGYGEWDILKRVSRWVDLVLYDIKVLDPERHRQVTGVSNDKIIHNLRQLVCQNERPWIVIRFLLVPGVNDDTANVEMLAEIAREYQLAVEILPYHTYGVNKYKQLGRYYALPEVPRPGAEVIEGVVEKLKARGISVRVSL